jgi:regulator of protease activity HflC (stomatin/prohibitin superfamily)
MFERLIDLLVEFAGLFKFWEIVEPYEEAVVTRLGKYHRSLTEGFHWVAPFAIERVYSDSVVPTTHDLAPQSLTTKDGRSVVVRAVITRSITDIRKAVLECEGVENVLVDSAVGAVADAVRAYEWEQLASKEFAVALTSEVRERARPWGVKIHKVQLADISASRSLRLWGAPL